MAELDGVALGVLDTEYDVIELDDVEPCERFCRLRGHTALLAQLAPRLSS